MSAPALPVPSEATMRASLVVLGVAALLIGLFQAIDPSGFVHDVGPFGSPNGHYVRDLSTWSLALGPMLILAAQRPSWRVPLLGFAALESALHLVNHLVDVNAADPLWAGRANAVALAAVLGVLVWLLLAARQAEATR